MEEREKKRPSDQHDLPTYFESGKYSEKKQETIGCPDFIGAFYYAPIKRLNNKSIRRLMNGHKFLSKIMISLMTNNAHVLSCIECILYRRFFF